MNINNLTNPYAQAVEHFNAPKTVWMAIAYDLAVQATGCEGHEQAVEILADTWRILNENKIVPQKLPSKLTKTGGAQ
jgi:hypothetical protein